jgi:hypothetical protein
MMSDTETCNKIHRRTLRVKTEGEDNGYRKCGVIAEC